MWSPRMWICFCPSSFIFPLFFQHKLRCKWKKRKKHMILLRGAKRIDVVWAMQKVVVQQPTTHSFLCVLVFSLKASSTCWGALVGMEQHSWSSVYLWDFSMTPGSVGLKMVVNWVAHEPVLQLSGRPHKHTTVSQVKSLVVSSLWNCLVCCTGQDLSPSWIWWETYFPWEARQDLFLFSKYADWT